MNKEQKYLKGIINEVFAEYYNKGGYGRKGGTSKTPKKYPGFYVKKGEAEQPDGTKKELAYFTLQNLDKEDAWDLRNNVIKGTVKDIKVPPSDKYPRGYTKYVIEFPVTFDKAKKWVEVQIPKIVNYLSSSTRAEYQNLDNLQKDAMRAYNDCPSEAELRRMEESVDNLKKEIYKAVQEGRFNDAMKIYNYSISLRARVYGHQLSPENAKAIQAQAEAAGLTPNDKGPDKFWPTFCRSEKTWNDWGRQIVDQPRMRYVVWSVYGSQKNKDVVGGLQRMGWSDASTGNLKNFGQQQIDKASMGSGGRQGKGIMYDISDTEPMPGTIDDFADKIGLVNNINGVLNAPALAKEKELLAKDEKDKADALANADAEKQKQLKQIQDDEGKAEVFIEALAKTESDSKTPIAMDDSSKSPLDNYINSLIRVAEGKIRQQKWSNDVDIRLMSLMIAAGVASKTVGASRIQALHPDFSAARFKDEGQFNTTVWPIMCGMINKLNKAVDDIYRQKNMATDAAQQITENFFNMLNRMNKVNEEFEPVMYPNCEEGEMDESMLPENQGMKKDILNFLGQFGLQIGGNEENNIQ